MDFKTYFLEEGIQEKLPILIKQFAGIPFFTKFKKYQSDGMEESQVRGFINNWAYQGDPTYPRADYITWIMKMVNNTSIVPPEDLPKTKERLAQFDKLKRTSRFTGPKDILQYKTFADLARTMDQFKGLMSKGEEVRTKAEQGVQLVKEMGVYNLWCVSTPEAASKLFRNTDWCVKDPKYFNEYAAKDPKFYYVEDNGCPAYLANFGSNQLKDVHDDTLDDNLMDIPHLRKLFSGLPEYESLKDYYKDHHNENDDPVKSCIDDYINMFISDIGQYMTYSKAKRLIKNPKLILKIVYDLLQDNENISEYAYEYAQSGSANEEEATEFAPLLNQEDGINGIELLSNDYQEDPDIFAENVIDYTISIDIKDDLVKLYASNMIDEIKKTDPLSFSDDDSI